MLLFEKKQTKQAWPIFLLPTMLKAQLNYAVTTSVPHSAIMGYSLNKRSHKEIKVLAKRNSLLKHHACSGNGSIPIFRENESFQNSALRYPDWVTFLRPSVIGFLFLNPKMIKIRGHWLHFVGWSVSAPTLILKCDWLNYPTDWVSFHAGLSTPDESPRFRPFDLGQRSESVH